MPTPTPIRLDQIAAQLTRIEAVLARTVPPVAVRASVAESSAHVTDVSAAAPLQGQQLAEVVDWIHERMSGGDLQTQFDGLSFVTNQLISIMHGTRDELVLMRADMRRLAALLAQSFRAQTEDDAWRPGDPDRRARERRKASGC